MFGILRVCLRCFEFLELGSVLVSGFFLSQRKFQVNHKKLLKRVQTQLKIPGRT